MAPSAASPLLPSASLQRVLLLAAVVVRAQEPVNASETTTTSTTSTATTSTSTTSTATTSTSTLTTTTTTTTTQALCTTLPCPDGFLPKVDASVLRCSSGVCDEAADRDICCDQFCLGGMRCPYYFFPKPGYQSLRCTGLCDQATDVPICCNKAESCDNFTCPDGFLPKERMWHQHCRGVECDLVEDISSCCDQTCSTFSCPAGSTRKPRAHCAGRCDAVMDQRTCCGYSAIIDMASQLINAAKTSDIVRVRRLGLMRADATARDSAGSSALHHASLHGHAELMGLLLEQRAELHGADGQGWTPLHVAAARGHNSAVALLLERRADPTMRTPPPGKLKALHLFSKVNGPTPPGRTEGVFKMLVEAERARADAANVGDWPYHPDLEL